MSTARITRRMALAALAPLWLPAHATSSRPGDDMPCLWRLPGLWEDEQERQVSMSAWAGRPALLTMAYGSCRRICSTSLRLLQEAQRAADARRLDMSVIVVSLDPRVDTPAAWRAYRSEHGVQRPNWHFLGGPPALVQRVAGLLDMKYWVYDDHVLHDLRIAAVDVPGHIVARLDWVDQPPGRLVDALAG